MRFEDIVVAVASAHARYILRDFQEESWHFVGSRGILGNQQAEDSGEEGWKVPREHFIKMQSIVLDKQRNLDYAVIYGKT